MLNGANIAVVSVAAVEAVIIAVVVVVVVVVGVFNFGRWLPVLQRTGKPAQKVINWTFILRLKKRLKPFQKIVLKHKGF